jgi:hypothetical protein
MSGRIGLLILLGRWVLWWAGLTCRGDREPGRRRPRGTHVSQALAQGQAVRVTSDAPGTAPSRSLSGRSAPPRSWTREKQGSGTADGIDVQGTEECN